MKPYLSDKLLCECCLNSDPATFTEKFQKHNFIVLECQKCSFNFVPWYYRKQITYTDYKDERVLEQVRKGDNWLKIQRNLLRFQFIRKFKKSGSLFDLGVGWGHFLHTGRLLGYDVHGIEISEMPYTYSKVDLDLPVHHIDFFEYQMPPKSFDLITMWDVLEHIDSAGPFVAKCETLLKDDGFLILQVPQIDSVIARWQKAKWNMMGLDHVNYFSRKTIKVLLERHGLEVVRIKSSIELKLLLLYTILPMINRLKGKKKGAPISSAERQEFYQKATKRPKWMLRTFVFFHNIVYKVLSFVGIGEEMIVVARKKQV